MIQLQALTDNFEPTELPDPRNLVFYARPHAVPQFLHLWHTPDRTMIEPHWEHGGASFWRCMDENFESRFRRG